MKAPYRKHRGMRERKRHRQLIRSKSFHTKAQKRKDSSDTHTKERKQKLETDMRVEETSLILRRWGKK